MARMSQDKPKSQSEDLFASLMEELNLSSVESVDSADSLQDQSDESHSLESDELGLLDLDFGHPVATDNLTIDSVDSSDNVQSLTDSVQSDQPDFQSSDFSLSLPDLSEKPQESVNNDQSILENEPLVHTDLSASAESSESVYENDLNDNVVPMVSALTESSDKTQVLGHINDYFQNSADAESSDDNERTVAVNGFSQRSDSHKHQDNVRISVGQSYGHSAGYNSWGSTDSQFAQVENLKIAQQKILDLEKENEKLRLQNQELIAATEIVKERSELLSQQVLDYKNDREHLEESFKNEVALLKSQLNRKEQESVRSQMKIEELDSRLKFDLKKIRIRERELENRLELVRAEKNALVRSKDEQILDLRRKMDQFQLEVESYRQKCVELNRTIETNQDSFKRTTRALRLAMANLELQEENKSPLKKVD